MPHSPGDLYPTDAPGPFIVDPSRCWRMVYSEQLQATHCAVGAGVDRAAPVPKGRPLGGRLVVRPAR